MALTIKHRTQIALCALEMQSDPSPFVVPFIPGSGEGEYSEKPETLRKVLCVALECQNLGTLTSQRIG